MVHSITPPDDCSILDRKQKAKRFFYQQNSSKDPWAKFNAGVGTVKDRNKTFPKPSNTTSSQKVQGFNLENIWSIRNDVPFQASTTKTSTANKPPNYSRYKNINNPGKKISTQESFDTPTNTAAEDSWNVKRQTFSFNTTTSNKYHVQEDITMANDDDDDDEFNYATHSKKAKISHAPEPSRQTSARTQRAQKFQTAYLKSRGLGEHATSSKHYDKQDEFGWE